MVKGDSKRFLELIENVEGLMEQAERLRRELRYRLSYWKACVQLGLDFRRKDVMLERRHQLRPETVTHLKYLRSSEPVWPREWKRCKYADTIDGYHTMDGKGVLPEDIEAWVSKRYPMGTEVFRTLGSADSEGREWITHIIFDHKIDRPTYEVEFPIPIHFPRKQ